MTGVRSTTQLHRAIAPLMDSAVHSTAMLVLHLTGHTHLETAEVERHLKVLMLLGEAVEAAGAVQTT